LTFKIRQEFIMIRENRNIQYSDKMRFALVLFTEFNDLQMICETYMEIDKLAVKLCTRIERALLQIRRGAVFNE